MPVKQARSHVLIPFVREKTRHITVVGSLGGKPARLIVDTGAGATAIDSSLLKKYGLSLSSFSRKGGGVGTSTMRVTTVRTHNLSLAGLDLSSFKLVAFDLSHVRVGLAKKKVPPIAGVLGADVFIRCRAVIDYARGCIILSGQRAKAT